MLGFVVVDVLVFTLAAFGLLQLIRFVTADVRMKGGRCPECNYDLQERLNEGCPECGWGRRD